MRIRSAGWVVVAAVLAVCTAACGSVDTSLGGLLKAYEYEEDMYLSLDGSATLYVNSSVAALDALRGATFDTNPEVVPDRELVRAYFESPNTHVQRITFSRRSNRRFIHVRLGVDQIQRLPESKPFAWSAYSFQRQDNLFYFKQTIGAAVNRDVGTVGWKGNEVVGFRMHLPSKIAYHNAGAGNPQRGNILAWEQPLSDRRTGTPLVLDARMETQSILYRTLALFGTTFVVVAVLFVILLWWVVRRAKQKAPARA
jgi:hypothetical protein